MLGGHGTPQFDEVVWQILGPSTERRRNLVSDWDKMDEQMKKHDAMYHLEGYTGTFKGEELVTAEGVRVKVLF